MSEAALALTGDETASPNSGESPIIFVFTMDQCDPFSRNDRQIKDGRL
jgi:hypothetical protein